MMTSRPAVLVRCDATCPRSLTLRPRSLSLQDLIGNTPLVRVTRFDTGLCSLFLKLESQNPGGSIKDRIGLAMIETAERQGLLHPGGVVVEATAGNTGLGLALVARSKVWTQLRYKRTT
jgi:cystathionine beta-synthase